MVSDGYTTLNLTPRRTKNAERLNMACDEDGRTVLAHMQRTATHASDPGDEQYNRAYEDEDEAEAEASVLGRGPTQTVRVGPRAAISRHPTPGGEGTAMREQAAKLPYHLIPPEYNVLLALVLEHGAAKYAPRNFEKGLPFADLLRGAEAHLTKLKLGEVRDADSGLPHAAHAAWNLLTFAMQMMRQPTYDYASVVAAHRGRGAPTSEASLVVNLRGLK